MATECRKWQMVGTIRSFNAATATGRSLGRREILQIARFRQHGGDERDAQARQLELVGRDTDQIHRTLAAEDVPTLAQADGASRRLHIGEARRDNDEVVVAIRAGIAANARAREQHMRCAQLVS